VQSAIIERRDAGCAVVMISDDLDEIMMVADRIAVMYEGKVMGVFDRAEFDREHIGLLMGGRVEAAS
jgi:simple sugar transport system ATP-binding protein